ncbi:hypothetical protein AB1K83_06290 [Sporosarcina sp. 179-K 3D1 HS]|uniref:hypothetical protein n=1 Tax=Sporosarcina sp. 179-K 3D1 HS TaxID=3232169 RepID=UPI0039A04A6B
MIKELLRTIGLGCLLAGGVLYFTTDMDNPTDAELTNLQEKLKNTEEELTRTKEALAMTQTASSVDTKPVQPPVKQEPKNEREPSDKELSTVVGTKEGAAPTIKTVLTIQSGSNSTSVSASLERLGIVKDASEFDSYLASQGLTGKIQIGEHELDSSMDFKTIARIITK